MSEGITYNDLGTIDVTFDGQTYHLGRPKMRQFRHFTGQLEKVTNVVRDELTRLQLLLADATKRHQDESTPEAKAEIDDLTEQVRAFGADPFYDKTAPIVAEMFRQLGDPLPEDTDEWPVWLAADSSLPGEILKHWRTHPKASGTPPEN